MVSVLDLGTSSLEPTDLVMVSLNRSQGLVDASALLTTSSWDDTYHPIDEISG
jgi:hypothetical protein